MKLLNRLKIYRDRNILYELTRKSIKTQYRDSALGLLWTVLNPLLNTMIMYFVFTSLLKTQDDFFALYLLCGNILFAALRASTTQSLEASVRNRELLLRTKIDLYVFPTSACLSSIVNFLFSLIALLPFMLWLSIQFSLNLFTPRLFCLLLLLPPFLLFELGIGLFLDALFVFFRDIKHIYDVFLTLWMYITPIFYKVDTMPAEIGSVIKLNPMYHFILYFRECVYLGAVEHSFPSFETFGILVALAAISLTIGIIVFKSLKNKIITRI